MKKLLENRLVIAQIIALVATVISVIGLIMNWKMVGPWDTMTGLGVLFGLISYIFGGLLTAVKMALKIAKWGWYVAPLPWDIITGILSFGVALIAFVMLPIIPIRKAYKEKMAGC